MPGNQVPADYVKMLYDVSTQVLDGRNAYLSDGVQRALGRPPRTSPTSRATPPPPASGTVIMRAMTRPPAGLVMAGEEAAPATTERLRLARELHDGEAGREQAREALRTIRTASRQGLKDLPATVATLRGGSGTDGPVPGVAQLDALISLAGDAGVRVGLTVQDVARRLPSAVDLATYGSCRRP